MEKYLLEYKKLLEKNIPLTNDEIMVLENYKYIGYIDINNLLRNVFQDISLDFKKITKKQTLEEILLTYYNNNKTNIEILDKIIKKSPILSNNIKVYRGIRIDPNDKNYYILSNTLDKLINDKKIVVNEFLSTSMDINLSKKFTFYPSNLDEKNHKYVLFEISFPKKTKAFPLTWTEKNNKTKEIVQNSETEILLPRGGEFILKKIRNEKISIPIYRWKNIQNNIPKMDFIIYEVNFIPPKKTPLITNFNDFKMKTNIEINYNNFNNIIYKPNK